MKEQFESTTEERNQAALGYLLWPIAALELLQSRYNSRWCRIHLRQAALYGAFSSAVLLIVLALPLLVVAFTPEIAPNVIIWIYVPAFVLDFAVFGWVLVSSVRLSMRASRGELFRLPVVGRLATRGLTR